MRVFGLMYENGYFQSWAFIVRLERMPVIGKYVGNVAKWLCGKLTRHQPSKTEWGYGGGDFGDVWCRWCNQAGQIPRAELADRYANARKTIWESTGCDIKQPISSDEKNGTA